MAIKGVQKRRDFVAGRRVVIVCDHDIVRNYCFHWLNVGSGESQRDKCAVVLMSGWNIFFVIILLFSLFISTTVEPPLTWYNSHYFWQTVHTLTPRVLSRIYRLAEKSRVAKGNELPRGVWGGMPPLKLFKINMRWDAIWYILGLNFAKCYSVCTNLVIMSGWYFRYSFLYTVMRTIFFFWGGGKLLPLKHPR